MPEQKGGAQSDLLSAAQAPIPRLQQGSGSQLLLQGDPSPWNLVTGAQIKIEDNESALKINFT